MTYSYWKLIQRHPKGTDDLFGGRKKGFSTLNCFMKELTSAESQNRVSVAVMSVVSINVHLFMAGTASVNSAVGWWAFIYCKRLVIVYMALILELLSLEYQFNVSLTNTLRRWVYKWTCCCMICLVCSSGCWALSGVSCGSAGRRLWMLEPSCLTQLGVGPCCFMSSVGLGLLVPEACIEVPLGRSCCMGVARRRKKKRKEETLF